ncbi:MAG: anthranilate synthase component I family protein [Ferruginibacter sp.]
MIEFHTSFKKIAADIYTPVGIYLRLRDKFRDTILLESTDFHANENSYSIIGIHAIAGVEFNSLEKLEIKLPGEDARNIPVDKKSDIPGILWEFMKRFRVHENASKPINIAQGMFGYISYDAVQFFEKIKFTKKNAGEPEIPLARYRLYQYVIIIDHFKDELYICENHFEGLESNISAVESLIKNKDVPVFPFNTAADESSGISGDAYKSMVENAINACRRGDTFQVVLSRRFYQRFTGDDFNVYRALRSINPGPYLFYFDYGDYKLMGSSPESQLIIDNGSAIVHPIAGTFRRTGDDETDKKLATELENDPKEIAEHVMLVDLARNDLSRVCNQVEVTKFKQVKYYSHLIHLVSEVKGKIGTDTNPFRILGSTFPAGTLSGAPKYKAMQIIDANETNTRGFYGGAIGSIGFNGSCNHAIMIRTFLSRNNVLISQAGAGVTVSSDPGKELLEVDNKLKALKSAIAMAKTIID